MITKAEYLWIDGCKPTAKLRSKTKIIEGEVHDVSDLPEWGFDGSSTMQAEGHFSECLLRPVYFVKDLTPPFDAPYEPLPELPTKPAVDEIFMMDPPSEFLNKEEGFSSILTDISTRIFLAKAFNIQIYL